MTEGKGKEKCVDLRMSFDVLSHREGRRKINTVMKEVAETDERSEGHTNK